MKPNKPQKPMTYEQHLDEVATLLTEKYDLEDELAIAIVMRAQAAGYFSIHDDKPAMCTLDQAHEDTRTVFKKFGPDNASHKAAKPAPKPAAKAAPRQNFGRPVSPAKKPVKAPGAK